ncbi:MAG: hypothetical protein F6J92_01780 [Symploca sp. SIO1A3]|nr:hypothetical protein [Symploca sp. SIO1A3]
MAQLKWWVRKLRELRELRKLREKIYIYSLLITHYSLLTTSYSTIVGVSRQ